MHNYAHHHYATAVQGVVPHILLILKKADLATGRERHLTTGKRAERTSTSGTQFAALPLVNPVVWFARAVVNRCSRSVAKSA